MITKDGVWGPLKIAAYRSFTEAVETILALKPSLKSIQLALGSPDLKKEIRDLLEAAAAEAKAEGKADAE